MSIVETTTAPKPRLSGRLCRCTECGKTFGGESAFDLHRTGEFATATKPSTRRCRGWDEMVKVGLITNIHSGIWSKPYDADSRQRQRQNTSATVSDAVVGQAACSAKPVTRSRRRSASKKVAS